MVKTLSVYSHLIALLFFLVGTADGPWPIYFQVKVGSRNSTIFVNSRPITGDDHIMKIQSENKKHKIIYFQNRFPFSFVSWPTVIQCAMLLSEVGVIAYIHTNTRTHARTHAHTHTHSRKMK